MAREVYLADAAAERTYGEAADQPKFFVNRIYEVVRPQKKPVYEFVKRAADIIFSMIFLVLLSPVFAAAAIAIKREDGGPAIYKQKRMTKDGRIFTMYKFRSMYLHAEEYLEELQKFNQIKDGPAFKMDNDPRITKVGSFIRRTSIDELPQLFNILKGEMTFVGPRPPLVSEVEKYNSYQRQRLGVKQGLTCFWQCSGRNNIGFEEWVALDLKYIKTRGIWTDIKILLKTVSAVLRMDGAC
jgi:lipopolysaccharide/colanic/teichoic acid biosynthesis glycosyltransferase